MMYEVRNGRSVSCWPLPRIPFPGLLTVSLDPELTGVMLLGRLDAVFRSTLESPSIGLGTTHHTSEELQKQWRADYATDIAGKLPRMFLPRRCFEAQIVLDVYKKYNLSWDKFAVLLKFTMEVDLKGLELAMGLIPAPVDVDKAGSPTPAPKASEMKYFESTSIAPKVFEPSKLKYIPVAPKVFNSSKLGDIPTALPASKTSRSKVTLTAPRVIKNHKPRNNLTAPKAIRTNKLEVTPDSSKGSQSSKPAKVPVVPQLSELSKPTNTPVTPKAPDASKPSKTSIAPDHPIRVADAGTASSCGSGTEAHTSAQASSPNIPQTNRGPQVEKSGLHMYGLMVGVSNGHQQ